MDKGNVMATLSPTPVYEYLKSLIGSSNAWRTNGELAREMGDDSPQARDQVAKAMWYLGKSSMVTRRMRAGTGLMEAMALVVDARKPTQVKAARSDIVMPAPGAVPVRVEPIPEPTPEAVEAVEKLVRSPTPSLTLADVLAKQKQARMEQILAGSMPPSLPEITPGSAPDATEGATVAPTLDVAAELAGIAARCVEDNESTIVSEICGLMALAQRGARRVAVERLQDKKSTLVMLAEVLRSQYEDSRTAELLDEIATDLERAGA